MNTPGSQVETAAQSLQDHRELLGAARAVESMLESDASPAPGDLARRLGTLATVLHEHVLAEESAPLYSDGTHPGIRGTLAMLAEEHTPLVREFQQLAIQAESASSVAFDTALSIAIRRAIARLRRHEAAESELMRQLSS